MNIKELSNAVNNANDSDFNSNDEYFLCDARTGATDFEVVYWNNEKLSKFIARSENYAPRAAVLISPNQTLVKIGSNNYEIYKNSVNISGVTVSELANKIYNGTSQKQDNYTLTYEGKTLGECGEPIVASNLKLGGIVYLGHLRTTELRWRVCGFGPNCESTSSSGAPYLVLENNYLSSYGFDLKHTGDPIDDRNNSGSNNWKNFTKIWNGYIIK